MPGTEGHENCNIAIWSLRKSRDWQFWGMEWLFWHICIIWKDLKVDDNELVLKNVSQYKWLAEICITYQLHSEQWTSRQYAIKVCDSKTRAYMIYYVILITLSINMRWWEAQWWWHDRYQSSWPAAKSFVQRMASSEIFLHVRHPYSLSITAYASSRTSWSLHAWICLDTVLPSPPTIFAKNEKKKYHKRKVIEDINKIQK